MTLPRPEDINVELYTFNDRAVNPEEIVPEHYRQELLTMQAVEDRSAWRTGDIALDIWADVRKKGLDITKGEVCIAVGYYRGLNPRRVMNITHTCAKFPPEMRTFGRAFSVYEKLNHALEQDQIPLALQMSEKLEAETGHLPIMQDIIDTFQEKKPYNLKKMVTTRVDRFTADMVILNSMLPEHSDKILKIIDILTDIKAAL